MTACRPTIQIWTIVLIAINCVGVVVVIVKEKSPPNIPSRLCFEKGRNGTFIIAVTDACVIVITLDITFVSTSALVKPNRNISAIFIVSTLNWIICLIDMVDICVIFLSNLVKLDWIICLADMIITFIDSTGINLGEICVGTIFLFIFAGKPRLFKRIFLVGLKCPIKLSSYFLLVFASQVISHGIDAAVTIILRSTQG